MPAGIVATYSLMIRMYCRPIDLYYHIYAVLRHSTNLDLGLTIVNRGEWLGSPANFKGTDKGDNMDVE